MFSLWFKGELKVNGCIQSWKSELMAPSGGIVFQEWSAMVRKKKELKRQ